MREAIDARTWRFMRDGCEWGPLSAQELAEMANAGELPHDTPVRHDTDVEWRPLNVAMLEAFAEPGQAEVPRANDSVLSYFVPRQTDLRYAGFWVRALALLMDYVVIAVAAAVVFAVLAITGLVDSVEREPFVQLFALLGIWLYFALLESSQNQATFGKLGCGLVVTDEFGERIRFGRATARFFCKILSAWFLIGFVMAAFTKRKQAMHDLIANTLVIRR